VTFTKILENDQDLWDLFTRKEEYKCERVDNHDRFSYSFSKNREILSPKCSEYLLQNGLKVEYPGNKKFAVCLTHDIDNLLNSRIYRYLNSLRLIKKRQLKEAFTKIIKKNREKFETIMKLEEKYRMSSTFYVMTTTKHLYYKPYDIRDIKNELIYLEENGWEVGVHGGYYSYLNYDYLKTEKQRLEDILGKSVEGHRSHYLRLKVPETWELLAKAGFNYDSTLGYDDTVGFRNGMCHPFKPFNLEKGCEIDIIELPLVVMDKVIFLPSKLGLGLEQGWQICKKLIDTTRILNGVITFVWHYEVFDETFFPGWDKIYEKILSYSTNKNAWLTNASKLCNFWKQNVLSQDKK